MTENELTDRTHTRIVSFIVLDAFCLQLIMIILFTKIVQIYGHCLSGMFTSPDCRLNGMAALPSSSPVNTVSPVSLEVPPILGHEVYKVGLEVS